jgi:hypothetical protein
MRIPFCLMFGFSTLLGCGEAQDAKEVAEPKAAAPKAEPGKMLTRFFRVVPTWGDLPAEKEPFPLILDGLEDNPTTRTSDARPFFEARGVAFPPEATAVYYRHASILRVTNTAENLAKVGEVMNLVQNDEPLSMVRVEVRVVEYPMEVEDRLEGNGSLAALQQKLGLKVVCASSVLTKSGNRALGVLDGAETNGRGKLPKELRDWPPPADVECALLEVEPNILFNRDSTEAQLSFRYAAPAKRGQPAFRVEVATNFNIPDGKIVKLQAFTVRDAKQPPRHYAVLGRFEVMDGHGRTGEERRAAFQKLMPKK